MMAMMWRILDATGGEATHGGVDDVISSGITMRKMRMIRGGEGFYCVLVYPRQSIK